MKILTKLLICLLGPVNLSFTYAEELPQNIFKSVELDIPVYHYGCLPPLLGDAERAELRKNLGTRNPEGVGQIVRELCGKHGVNVAHSILNPEALYSRITLFMRLVNNSCGDYNAIVITHFISHPGFEKNYARFNNRPSITSETDDFASQIYANPVMEAIQRGHRDVVVALQKAGVEDRHPLMGGSYRAAVLKIVRRTFQEEDEHSCLREQLKMLCDAGVSLTEVLRED